MSARVKLFNDLLVLIFLIALTGCGQSSQANQPVTVTPAPAGQNAKGDLTAAPSSAPTVLAPAVSATTTLSPAKVYGLGETAQLGDQKITLDKVSYYATGRQVTFIVENTGSKAFDLSTLAFTAADSDGKALAVDNQRIEDFGGCGSVLPRMLMPGQKVTGTECWLGAPVFPTNRISVFSGRDETLQPTGPLVSWDIPGRPGSPMPWKYDFDGYYKVGDVIQLADQTITLSSIRFLVDGVKIMAVANFIIENIGSKVINLDPDRFYGSLEELGNNSIVKVPDCGWEGQIEPGHILQGSLCWEFSPTTDLFRIDFSYDLNAPQPVLVVWMMPVPDLVK